jgi:hypothetical protein
MIGSTDLGPSVDHFVSVKSVDGSVAFRDQFVEIEIIL